MDEGGEGHRGCLLVVEPRECHGVRHVVKPHRCRVSGSRGSRVGASGDGGTTRAHDVVSQQESKKEGVLVSVHVLHRHLCPRGE